MNRDGVVAMGRADFLPGFGLAGIRTIEASPSTAMELFSQEKNAAIIIMEDSIVASLTAKERMTIEMSTEPAVILLSRDATMYARRLDRLISSTIGIDPKIISYDANPYNAPHDKPGRSI
ncbi:TPA: hypothetical protein HA251_04780 [Candidatus Woesearchaeota archaeon]|nr:hypothetical protein [Candidatus Woesearchaeota archaeon]